MYNLILDIDGTLIQSLETKVENTKLRYTPILRFNTYHRPHLEEFLEFVFENFNVSIWTCGTSGYMELIINDIIKKIIKEPKINLSLSAIDCEYSQENYGKHSFKNLRYVFDLDHEFNVKNTILIDDDVTNINENKYNCFGIKPFLANSKNAENDVSLLNIMNRLKDVLKNKDDSLSSPVDEIKDEFTVIIDIEDNKHYKYARISKNAIYEYANNIVAYQSQNQDDDDYYYIFPFINDRIFIDINGVGNLKFNTLVLKKLKTIKISGHRKLSYTLIPVHRFMFKHKQKIYTYDINDEFKPLSGDMIIDEIVRY
jgi:hypothetical protein